MYAIQVDNGEYKYILGMYLGNVDKEEKVLPLRDYHPSLAKGVIFKNLQQASSVAANLNISQETNKFKVIEVNSGDMEHQTRYEW